MIERYDSVVIEVVARAMVPPVQVFALYVITHGHYGPGGGFQGGVILAVSVLLLRLSLGKARSDQLFPPVLANCLAAIGMLIYVLAGLVPLLLGAEFLNYGYLPIPGVSGPALRSTGILIVELGIGLSVCGTMVTIFDWLTRSGR